MNDKRIFPFVLTACQIRNLKANARKMGRSAGSLIRERIADLIGGSGAGLAHKRTALHKNVSIAEMASVAMAHPFFDPSEDGFRATGKAR